MAGYIAIPKLSMKMVDATLVEWTVKEGDQVEKGDIVLTIEMEKTQWEIEACSAGFVHILVEEDVKVLVGRVVGLIAETKDELEALQKELTKEMFTTMPEPTEAASPTTVQAEEGKRVLISPVARKMAEEHMIDITTITGTGPDGRIVREDIERALEAK